MVLAALAFGCGGSTVSVSSATELTEALEGAAPGTVIRMAAGTYAGSFAVPAGVTLEGAGVGLTEVVAPTELDGLRLTGGAETATRVRGLAIVVDGGMGVRARGGRISLDDVAIEGARGAGAGFADADEVTLTRVEVAGPVTAENATALPPAPTPSDTLTYGIVFLRVARAVASEVSVRGTGLFGFTSIDSDLEWTTGDVTGALGNGVVITGGRATLTSVTVLGLFRGVRLPPAYGAAFVEADVTTSDLVVQGSEDLGALHSGGRAVHARGRFSDNAFGGLWAQGSDRVELRGGALERNGLLGVGAADVAELVVADLEVRDTTTQTRVVGAGPVDVGDALQLLRPTTVTLSALTLAGSERIGLLADGAGGSLRGVSIVDVTVSGAAAALGASMQNGEAEPGWDAGLERDAVTTANDLAHSGALDVLQVVAPTELPGAGALRTAGLDGVVAPTE